MADNRRNIERIIETDPVIKRGLQRGIINSRALARYIQESDGIQSSADAILGVIRRYPLTNEETPSYNHMFKDCELAMRTKVGDLALEIGPNVMKRVIDFASSVKTSRGENLRIVVGMKSIRVVADQKALSQFRETFRDEDVIRFLNNMVEITVILTPEAEQRTGVISRITTELALNDVCIQGSMCATPEVIMLIHEKDAGRAYEALQRMLSESSSPTESTVPETIYARA